ncbi:MAG: cytochrome c biogenesis protein CcsA [Candidatus Methanoperedenaceae archaeon]|nr:cytochrome c biogenesis protein CcsA [Candidatus Methanoperedenaceae archaeon]
MGFPEYNAAREALVLYGQPVLTYILLISVLQFLVSILYLWKKNHQFHDHLIKLLYVNTALYVVGFLFLIRFHIQIYNTVLIEYPHFLQEMVSVQSSRFAIPPWVENEKLYFWTMTTSVFVVMMQRRKDIVAFLGIILAVFSSIVYFFSNPFTDPLPGVHSEITGWYAALASSDPAIYQTAGTLFGRITYYYNSTYMWIHPPMLFIAYASLIITAAACVYMLIRQDRVYDEIAYRYAKIGYILLTAGMLIGYPWAIEAWKDSAWWWDPKISGSIMMWVLYSAYLHSRIYVNRYRMWKTTAYLGIICILSLVFTYLLTYIVPGIHSVVQP